MRLTVLYEDNHVIVVVKPVNVPVQADESGDPDLLTEVKQYIAEKYHKPGNVYLGLVHRLDRPVGGVMVFARTGKAASRLTESFRAHTTRKIYLAVAEGAFPAETYRDYLLKDEKTRMVSAVSETVPGAKYAELDTFPLRMADGLTLTRVTLKTGRSHQIRVQHAARRHPLWGDNRYGNGKPGQQIALWAASLTFEHPTTHENLTFTDLPSGGIWDRFSITEGDLL